MRYTLSKSEILRGKQNFQRIYSSGKKLYKNTLTCIYIIEKKDLPENKIQVGFSVNRKIKLAVVRNRCKRLMRESYRLNKNILYLTTKNYYNILIIFYFHKIIEDKNIKLRDITDDMVNILTTIRNEILKYETL